MFRGKLIGGFRFSRRGEYIDGRAASGGGPGVPATWWRGKGLARATLWCGRPLVPLRLCFGLRLMSGKIGTSAFVLSNSENISCVAFLKHKNSRKTGNSHCGILFSAFCYFVFQKSFLHSAINKMPQCQFPVFCCFCVSEKLHRKYSRNWTKQKPNLLFLPKLREDRR
jgi:hypothetical protein